MSKPTKKIIYLDGHRRKREVPLLGRPESPKGQLAAKLFDAAIAIMNMRDALAKFSQKEIKKLEKTLERIPRNDKTSFPLD